MATIEIILGGCGITYTDANGNKRHVLKTPEHGPFECDDTQAAYFVGKGVAKYARQSQPEEQAECGAEPSGDSGKLTGHLEPADLELMTVEQLKNLAADMGVDVSGCKKKADYVAALAAVEVEVEDEAILDNSDDLPEMSAVDPE